MKKIISILLVLVLSLSVITVTYADDMAIGLMVRTLSEKIVPGETFKVILFTNADSYPIYSYQFKVNFDNTYFKLDNVYSSVSGSIDGLKVIDNEAGTATYSAFINGAVLTENNNDNNYKIATLEFETLKTVDENKTISFRNSFSPLTLFKEWYFLFHSNNCIKKPGFGQINGRIFAK